MAADDYPRRAARAYANGPAPAWSGAPHPGAQPPAPPQPPEPHPKGRWPRWLVWTIRIFLLVLAALVVWLTVTAPLGSSLQPLGAPSVTVYSAEGEVIARKGAMISEPVDVTELPPHVAQAFIAVEDKRFFRHIGVDPYGLTRAMTRNLGAGSMVEGGSTITQQLAKTSFTGSDRTAFRKIQEGFIALWLEAWLSKEEILSRYLSNVYFGDNTYGLRAAARHYFSVDPDDLTLQQAAMLAGIVNAPSRLAPTRNIEGARERAELVIRRMRAADFITEREARAYRPARLRVGPRDDTPTGTYFADWVLGQRDADDESYGEREIHTTLELPLQQQAERVVRNAGLGRAQVALVAMRTDGRIVAMVGGKNYERNAFNRATQARRQPGSTFKLFVYLAALRNGWSPNSPIDDSPITTGEYRPQNYNRQYRGQITLAEAFAQSSNVATIRLAQHVGMPEVIRAARDLGISAELPNHPSLPLGTAGISLLEMTAAYAAVASDGYPVTPNGISDRDRNALANQFGGAPAAQRRDPAFAQMRTLLSGVVTRGTGTAANLSVPAYGKTGTTQDYRDAVFIGFSGDLVVGVWVGNDDNRPLPGITGGSLPARIWRGFMSEAVGAAPAAAEQAPVEEVDANLLNGANALDPLTNGVEPVDPLKPTDDPSVPLDPADGPPLTTPPAQPQRERDFEFEDSVAPNGPR